jgi:hypothetical protein
MVYITLAVATAACVVTGNFSVDDKKAPAGPIVLRVESKKEKYVIDSGQRTAKEYRADLEEMAKKQEKNERIDPPQALPIDLVLKLENTSSENVTVYVNGTGNTHTFELTGGTGVVMLKNTIAMPALVRLPMAVTIEPGKSYDIPIHSLSDGRRGISRLIYWTGPGEYTLTAKYILLNQKGAKVEELQSEPVKIKVTEK